MSKKHKFKIYDGNYEIIYSNDFIIYENKLIIEDVYWFKIIMNFKSNKKNIDSNIERLHNQEEKLITLNVTNFNYNTWTWLKNKFALLKNVDWKKKLYFSIYSNSINKTTSFLHVSLTFYIL